jgi:hypothetical protein
MRHEVTSGAGATGARATPAAGGGAAVVVTTHDQARFLPDALASCLGQSVPPVEIVVVDDGSTDDPAAVAGRFRGVGCIRQERRGPSAARNAGLAVLTAPYVVFLDADDRLLPHALETGLATAARHPDAAIVYGGFRLVDAALRPIFRDEVRSIMGDPYLAFLRGNVVGMIAAAMCRRDLLLAAGGFDEGFRLAEDYELYLRLVRDHPVACHGEVVAEYRKHGQNISDDAPRMLAAALAALDRQSGFAAAYPGGAAGLAAGRRAWRAFFALRAWKGAARALAHPGRRGDALRLLRDGMSMGPHYAALGAARWLARQSGGLLRRGDAAPPCIGYHVPARRAGT